MNGRAAAKGLAALLGLGICLGSTGASAGGPAPALFPRISPQRGAARQAAIPRKAEVTRAPNPGRRNLLIAGTSTLGGFWTASAVTAGLLALKRQPASEAPCKYYCVRPEKPAGSPAALLIPVVGPWIGLGTLKPSAAGAVGLTVLGVGQAIGVGMLIGGVTLPMRVPVQKGRVIQMGATPMITPHGLGLSIHGAM